MGDFFSYLKIGGAAVSAAPTKQLNTFYLVGALLALAVGALETSAPPFVGECYKLVGALETSAPPFSYLKLFGC